jgi:hypothetical protein
MNRFQQDYIGSSRPLWIGMDNYSGILCRYLRVNIFIDILIEMNMCDPYYRQVTEIKPEEIKSYIPDQYLPMIIPLNPL